MLFHLAKFCRICIKTDGRLYDINTVDADMVTLSQKLEMCTKMVISRESLSTKICFQCVKKLRAAYEFQISCKESTKILQGYLSELISGDKVTSPESYVNSELRVTITPIDYRTHRISNNVVTNNNKLHVVKKRRITKGQRCILLRKLLQRSKNGNHKNIIRHKPKWKHSLKHKEQKIAKPNKSKCKGGLKDIINFTKNYNFEYTFNNQTIYNHDENTPLSQLINFTNTFFLTDDFNSFKSTVLFLIENQNDLSEIEEDEYEVEKMFNSNPDPQLLTEFEIKCEELVIEPDIKIEPPEYDESDYSTCNYYVETSYSDSECKKGLTSPVVVKQEIDAVQMLDKFVGNLGAGTSGNSCNSSTSNNDNVNNNFNYVNKFYSNNYVTFNNNNIRTFSPLSSKCRTRDNPYISPSLKQQFQLKSFHCEKCNRYFKSIGYLKAHFSKIHLQ